MAGDCCDTLNCELCSLDEVLVAMASHPSLVRGNWLLAVDPVLGRGRVGVGGGVVAAVTETQLLQALGGVHLPRGNSLQKLLLAFTEGHSDVRHPLHHYLLQKGR